MSELNKLQKFSLSKILLFTVFDDHYRKSHDFYTLQHNPFKAKFSDALHNASEKPFYQITHTIYFLETIYVTALAKPALLAPKLNSILLLQFTDTLNIYPSPVHQVLNVNRSAFLNGILPTLQSCGWNNGTHGGHQLHSEDLYLLPLAVWCTGVLLATAWASWLLMGCPKG